MTEVILTKGCVICSCKPLPPPPRLGPPAADWWKRAHCFGSDLWNYSEGGASPQRACRRLSPEKLLHWSLERAPPGGCILSAGQPHLHLPAGAGSASPWRQSEHHAGQGPGDTLPPKGDFGLDRPAGGEAGGGRRDPAGARQRGLPGASVSGSERVQRREYTIPNGDTGGF